jgi:hypothetical protein
MSPSLLRILGTVCFVSGFVSIIASIAVWALAKEPDAAHGERFGIFIGLWAPTFFALSAWFERRLEKAGVGAAVTNTAGIVR